MKGIVLIGPDIRHAARFMKYWWPVLLAFSAVAFFLSCEFWSVTQK